MASANINSVVAFATRVLGDLPSLIAAGVNVVNLVNSARESLSSMAAENRGPTKQEWDALDDEVNRLRQQLHGP